MWMIC